MFDNRYLFLVLPTNEISRKFYTVGPKLANANSGSGMTLFVTEDVPIVFGDTGLIDLGVCCVCIRPSEVENCEHKDRKPSASEKSFQDFCASDYRQEYTGTRVKKRDCDYYRVLPGLQVLARAFNQNIYEQVCSPFNRIDVTYKGPLVAQVHNLLDENLIIRAGSPLFKLIGPSNSLTDFEVLAPNDPRVAQYFSNTSREGLKRSGSKRDRGELETSQHKRQARVWSKALEFLALT